MTLWRRASARSTPATTATPSSRSPVAARRPSPTSSPKQPGRRPVELSRRRCLPWNNDGRGGAAGTESMTEFDQLRAEAESCTLCPLARTRTNVVFGVGRPDSQLMFVGEAPGRDEDLQGEPFVGRAGQLLDRLLAEVGISRDTVYIANVLKCRPPGNRNPQPVEIDACKGYLRSQIRLIRPRVVVTLGNFATKLLLRTEMGITRLRGQAFPWWLDATL